MSTLGSVSASCLKYVCLQRVGGGVRAPELTCSFDLGASRSIPHDGPIRVCRRSRESRPWQAWQRTGLQSNLQQRMRSGHDDLLFVFVAMATTRPQSIAIRLQAGYLSCSGATSYASWVNDSCANAFDS